MACIPVADGGTGFNRCAQVFVDDVRNRLLSCDIWPRRAGGGGPARSRQPMQPVLHPRLDQWNLDHQRVQGRRILALCSAVLQRRPRPSLGGRFGGVEGVAADQVSQAGQPGCQGGELAAQLLNLLLLGQDEGWGAVAAASQSAAQIQPAEPPIARSLGLRCDREAASKGSAVCWPLRAIPDFEQAQFGAFSQNVYCSKAAGRV